MEQKEKQEKEKFSLSRVFNNLSSEFHKIIWPTKEDTTKQTVACIVVMALLSLFIFGLDQLIVWVLYNVMGIS